MPDDNPPRVELAVHRTVRVLGVDDRPAVELTNINGAVSIVPLPRNSGKRQPVRLDDLSDAIEQVRG